MENLLHSLFKLFPIPVSIAGKGSRPLLKISQIYGPTSGLKTVDWNGQSLKFDCADEKERFFYCYFQNILRYYQISPLGKYLALNLKADEIFVDIGANFGFYSLLAICRGAQAVLFEPDASTFQFLKNNSETFREVFKLALANYEGKSTFFVSQSDHMGASSLVLGSKSLHEAGYSHTDSVEVTTFDRFLSAHTLPQKNVKLLKIDCEGSEVSVLQGMPIFLKSNPQVAVWCEVRGPTSDRAPNSYKEVVDLFLGLGFHPWIFEGGKNREMVESDIKQVFDLLFLREH